MTTVVLNTVTRKVEVFSSARDVQARAEIADHKAAADPHPQYLADADLAEVALSGDAGDLIAGTVPDARMPSWTGYIVASRTALQAANVPAAVVGLRLLGYSTVGDGGGAHYKRVASEPAHPHKIQSADGAWWEELFAVDVTVSIPSHFATLQDAIDRLSKQPVRRGASIILNIESGHALTAGFKVENGDYSHFTITSTDAEVALAAGWTAGTSVAEGINARMPNWGILVNCGGKNTGSQALKVNTNSSLQVLSGKGLKNAGASGLFVNANSRVTGSQAVFTGCSAYNVWITHLSHGYLERGNFTGSTGPEGNVFVSRGSVLYAVGANFSNSAGPGMTIRRSLAVIFPFGGTNTIFSSNGTRAILASDHSTVIAHTRSGDVVAFSNCGANGVDILNGSHADLRGATFNTVAGDAINITHGAQVIIDNAVTFTSVSGNNLSQAANILTGAGVIYNDNAADLIYHKQNILGTVSQASGTPTGAVIERGSNANGQYIRFADGTQICTRSVSHNLNLSSSQDWTFPAAFIALPVASFGVEGNTAADLTDWYTRTGSAWATGTGWRTRAPTGANIGKTVTLQLTATGRWF
jgi:hypothetical protein